MADPVIANHYKAMVIFQGYSGLPEDRFVNTFTFQGTGGSVFHEAAHTDIVTMLTAFYDGFGSQAPYTTTKIRTYMTGYESAEIRTYALGVPPPREPIISQMEWVTAVPTSQRLPAEVACVASFRGQAPGPRHRGRVYIGPLNYDALQVVDGHPRVHTDLQNILLDRMADLAGSTMDANWVVLSRASGTSSLVVGGWVDNAFDTQRRRGRAPTARQTWGYAGPVPLP